jgi:hypothetical protein
MFKQRKHGVIARSEATEIGDRAMALSPISSHGDDHIKYET